MSWLPTDCHAHTRLSDGQLTVAELERTVRARGVRPSVSDHLSGDVRYARATADQVRSYLDELERHDVLRSGEFCWHDDLWRNLPAEVVSRFTHWIGSVHAVRLPAGGVHYVFDQELPPDMTALQFVELFVENVERLSREMPIDILAHPTLLPLSLRELEPEDLWEESLEERLVVALASAGIAFEISARYRPHPRIVRRAWEHGARLSLGSDGHTAQQVGEISAPLALAREIGIPDDALYDPELHGSRAVLGVAALRR
jgi:histidinol phosphatase-like PHP family hydrolase